MSEKLADEQKKLKNNIALDAAEAGKASTALPFDATVGSARKTRSLAVARDAASADAQSTANNAAADDSDDDDTDDEADDATDDEADDSDASDDEAEDDD